MSTDPAYERWVAEVREKLGQNVKHLREAGLTQADLGRETGLHWSYISAVERGARNPGIDNLGALASGLNVALSELFVGMGNLPAPPPKHGRQHPHWNWAKRGDLSQARDRRRGTAGDWRALPE